MKQKVLQCGGKETDLLAFKGQFTLTPLQGPTMELHNFTHHLP